MNTPPARYGGSSISSDPHQYGISNTGAGNIVTNNIHGDSNKNVGNVSHSYNNVINVGVNDGPSQIQAWLSPLKPHRRHQDVRNRRLEGVGDWVLRRNEFESWCKGQDGSESSTLLCYGVQGVGKTYISSLVIDTLRDQARGLNIAVLSLYCDYQAHKDQSGVNMIGSLLSQAATGATRIPGGIQSAFEESKQRDGQGLRLPDMLSLFVKAISSIERVYICVDAVDELLPQDRSEFLRALRQIIQDAPNTRLFLTGRPYIRAELDKHLTEGAYIIHIVADQGDIARYASQKMDYDHDRDPDLMTENLKNDIMKTIRERASEMFLLVSLNIDAILGESSLARRRIMLQKVATTGVDLDSVYAQTLQRIREQKGDRSTLGMEVLTWVSHSERPLRIDELCHALAIEVESTNLDVENIRPQDTVLGSCLGLVAVDKETSTVRLIHYTLQEYLSRPGILSNAHKTLAQICLAYLNHEQVKQLPANSAPNLRDMPFLEYSSFYWGSHAKMELSDRMKSLALELLNRYDNHISATLLFSKIKSFHLTPITRSLFTGLHCASYFGIVEVVAALIEIKGCDINQRDGMGFTPLMWAARQGNEGVVRLLLARNDVNPDNPDDNGRTPLCHASENGHEGVVRLLLTRNDVNPDKPDKHGQTPLWWASFHGHEGVAMLLLARDNVNSDKPDNYGQTPLWCASREGHNGVVRLLLTQDGIDPDKPDNYGLTPLGCASYGGHEGVVKLLLARNHVNPDKPDNGGVTPLSHASRSGHEGVVRLLLARGGVNPHKPDDYGSTPLSAASLNGHEGVLRLLLTLDDANPNKPDIHGRTALWHASLKGQEGVVRLLLTRSDVNPDQPNNRGRTPLWCASGEGYEGVVRLLLKQDNVNPNKPDNDGQTPLLIASRNEHEGVVRLLLTRDEINPDKPDDDGQTPLWSASQLGYEGVVRLLLARDDVNPDRPDNDGQTPLLIASQYGQEEVVRLLLTRDDVNPDKSNYSGQTPLWWASWHRYEGVVRLLLTRDVNPEKPSNDGRTPFLIATRSAHWEIVALLKPRTTPIFGTEWSN